MILIYRLERRIALCSVVQSSGPLPAFITNAPTRSSFHFPPRLMYGKGYAMYSQVEFHSLHSLNEPAFRIPSPLLEA